MKYYKNTNNEVFAFEVDGSQDMLITGDMIQLTMSEIDALLNPVLDPMVVEITRVVSLWQAAHNYEYAQISGSAIGLLAMGVMTGKPKCIAVQAWIKSIWTTYYTRKANGSTDTDYSFAGSIPHSVPEIMAEMGV